MNIRTPLAFLFLAIAPAAPAEPTPAAKLAALEPGHGAILGEAEVVGEFNAVAKHWRLHETGPRGRDFTIKMAWAPERKTALFCGANHGVPHRINDVWEFDLGAMRWTMLYAPDNSRSYTGLGKDHSDVVFKDGILQTERGGPAVIAHSWWGLTYDPASGHGLLVEFKRDALWAFDPDARRWTKLDVAGEPIPPGQKRLAYFDPARGVFVIIKDRTVWAYRYRA